jgi:hypothetical protein
VSLNTVQSHHPIDSFHSTTSPSFTYLTSSGSSVNLVIPSEEQTSSHPIDWDRLELERSFLLDDENEFVSLAKRINWENRTAEDHLKAIQMALTIGAHLVARRLSQDGKGHFPTNPEISKSATVLAPVETLRKDIPPDPSIGRNRDWLKAHRSEFRGQWVAIRDGELLARAPTYQQMKDLMGDVKGRGILILTA